MTKTRLVNKENYLSFRENLLSKSNDFKSNTELQKFIENETAKDKVIYITDEHGNIIITKTASDVTAPATVVVADYNYKTVAIDADTLATLHEVSTSKTNGGSVIAIFMNNENNEHIGAKNINKSYIPANSNVVYVSGGKKLYISNSSFASGMSDISIPYTTEPRAQNTGIKIKISGIKTDAPSSYISQQPDVFEVFSSIVSKYKNKSVSYQIADLKFGNNGNMYPSSLEFTLLVDSYNLDDTKEYFDGQVEKFMKANKKYFPDAKMTYSVVTDESKLPDTAISQSTIDYLTTYLYIDKNSNYRFSDDDKIPNKYSKGDVYATNTIEELYVEGDIMHLRMNTTGVTNAYRDQIIKDNTSAASLAGLTINTYDLYSAYENKDQKLSSALSSIYSNVNDKAAQTIAIPIDRDQKFTTMSLLSNVQAKANITHINLNDNDPEAGIKVTNTLLNYINSYTKSGLINL
ncbi:hypothetical protein QU661_04010 [Mogibacterium neglectum]|nr:hypothetical protein QU661_04010 [Mogibacterium neglectum]